MGIWHTSVIALGGSNIWVGGGRRVGHVGSRHGGLELRPSVVAHSVGLRVVRGLTSAGKAGARQTGRVACGLECMCVERASEELRRRVWFGRVCSSGQMYSREAVERRSEDRQTVRQSGRQASRELASARRGWVKMGEERGESKLGGRNKRSVDLLSHVLFRRRELDGGIAGGDCSEVGTDNSTKVL